MFTLRVRIDAGVLEALLPHAARAVEEGLLSEEETVKAVIDEVADRGLKIEIDSPWQTTTALPKPSPRLDGGENEDRQAADCSCSCPTMPYFQGQNSKNLPLPAISCHLG